MTVSLYVFPSLLKEFRREHPEVDVKVFTGPTDRLIRKLRSGGADVGLITLPIEEPDLVAVPVMREELMLVTYPTHPLAKRTRVEPEDLVRQPFILYEPGSNTRRVIDEFFLRESIRPRMVMETENVEIIKAMVKSGLGITVISHQAVEHEVREGELASCRIGGSTLVRETGWVYLKANRVPRKIEELIKALEKTLPRQHAVTPVAI
jgi:DNA-binding transcriptional LysR family regulator